MTTPTLPQTVLFPDLFDKPLVAMFDRQHASSDGGAVLLKAAERVYGLVAGFARCLVDRRELGKIRHTLTELLGQRIFGIACGHPDGNDADHLADDPIHKLLLGRDPVAGEALASQPTISRFENGVGPSVTTHSDYLIKELNNLIMLSSSFDKRASVMRRLRYAKDDCIAPERIRAYIAQENGLTRCQVDELGIDMPKFDETINKIDDVANELAMRLAQQSHD